jgi:hypothetical protein
MRGISTVTLLHDPIAGAGSAPAMGAGWIGPLSTIIFFLLGRHPRHQGGRAGASSLLPGDAQVSTPSTRSSVGGSWWLGMSESLTRGVFAPGSVAVRGPRASARRAWRVRRG